MPSTIVEKTRRELRYIMKDSRKQWTTIEDEIPVEEGEIPKFEYFAPLQENMISSTHMQSRADGIKAIDELCCTVKFITPVVRMAIVQSTIDKWKNGANFRKIDCAISVQAQEQACLLFDKFLCSSMGKNTIKDTHVKIVSFALACLCLARQSCDTWNYLSCRWDAVVAYLSGGLDSERFVLNLHEPRILQPVCSLQELQNAECKVMTALKYDVIVVSEIDVCAVQERLWESSVLEFNHEAREHKTIWKILEAVWRTEKSFLTWEDVGMFVPLTGTSFKSPELTSILLNNIYFDTNKTPAGQSFRVSLTEETWRRIYMCHSVSSPAEFVLPIDSHVLVSGHYFQPVRYTGKWEGKSPATLQRFVRAFSRRARLTTSPYMKSPPDLFLEALAAFIKLHRQDHCEPGKTSLF